MRPIFFRIVAAGCLASSLGLALAGVIGGSASAQPPTEGNPAVDKVTICHRDDDVEKPYVQETISTDAAWDRLQMPPNNVVGVFPTTPWGDIIPPFLAPQPPGDGKVHSLNWTADGQAIWNAGCLVDLTEPPIEPPTTTTTSQPEVTTTSGATTTTSSVPESTTTPPTGSTTTQPSESTTTLPGETTTSHPNEITPTTLPPTTTPTTAPPSELPPPVTDPGGGVEVMPPTEAVAVDPGPKTVDLGMLNPSERKTLEVEVDAATSATPTTTTTTSTLPPTPLAGTGVNVTPLLLTSLALILLGVLLLATSRRHYGRGATGPRVPH